MLIFKLAFRNLRRHSRKTALLGTLIATGIGLLFVVNAVFQGSKQGLESSLVYSLTGDMALSQKAAFSFSLFGSEIPVVSEYEGIPQFAEFSDIWPKLSGLQNLEKAAPVVSGLAKLSIGRFSVNSALFGVEPDSYFYVNKDIKIASGKPALISEQGVFLNSVIAAQAEEELGRPLKLGEAILLSMYSQGSFKLREGYFAGVHQYVSRTEALDRVVLVDPMLLRALSGYTLGNRLKNADHALPEDDNFDLDELFSTSMDIVTDGTEETSLGQLEAKLADTEERDLAASVDESAWSFVLLKAKPGARNRLKKEVEALIKELSPNIRLLSWRDAAGISALLIFALQYVFYIGLGFISLGAILVIMNALVISVLERVPEIGTMRSLGAGRPFIRNIFMLESLLLTGGSAMAGLIIAIIASTIMAKAGIKLQNPLLISLFGGETLQPSFDLFSVLMHIAMALMAASVSWIYPVRLAMRIKPVNAMNG